MRGRAGFHGAARPHLFGPVVAAWVEADAAALVEQADAGPGVSVCGGGALEVVPEPDADVAGNPLSHGLSVGV